MDIDIGERVEPGPAWYDRKLAEFNKRLFCCWLPERERWGIFHRGFARDAKPGLVWIAEKDGGFVALESGYIERHLAENDRMKFLGSMEELLIEHAELERLYDSGRMEVLPDLTAARKKLAQALKDWVTELVRLREQNKKERDRQMEEGKREMKESLAFAVKQPVTVDLGKL